MEVIDIEIIVDDIESRLQDEFVYDLETDVGTFVAGGSVNGILVKNTDSCYVTFNIERDNFETDKMYMEEHFTIAQKCADYCTSKFKPPMELAFEKYMYPLALYAKKRYAYKEWTNTTGPKKDIQYKGLQIVRRDTCPYVKEELKNIFNIIMKEKNQEDALLASKDYTRNVIGSFFKGNVDKNKLVLSKQLKSQYTVRIDKKSINVSWKGYEIGNKSNEYIINQPHVRLAQQLMLKDPANHPKPPDRVPYIFIQKKGNLLQCEKVIGPNEFDPKLHKIDSLYYFDHQFKNPLDMIFQFLLDDPTDLYSDLYQKKVNEINCQTEISSFFKSKTTIKTIIE